MTAGDDEVLDLRAKLRLKEKELMKSTFLLSQARNEVAVLEENIALINSEVSDMYEEKETDQREIELLQHTIQSQIKSLNDKDDELTLLRKEHLALKIAQKAEMDANLRESVAMEVIGTYPNQQSPDDQTLAIRSSAATTKQLCVQTVTCSYLMREVTRQKMKDSLESDVHASDHWSELLQLRREFDDLRAQLSLGMFRHTLHQRRLPDPNLSVLRVHDIFHNLSELESPYSAHSDVKTSLTHLDTLRGIHSTYDTPEKILSLLTHLETQVVEAEAAMEAWMERDAAAAAASDRRRISSSRSVRSTDYTVREEARDEDGSGGVAVGISPSGLLLSPTVSSLSHEGANSSWCRRSQSSASLFDSRPCGGQDYEDEESTPSPIAQASPLSESEFGSDALDTVRLSGSSGSGSCTKRREAILSATRDAEEVLASGIEREGKRAERGYASRVFQRHRRILAAVRQALACMMQHSSQKEDNESSPQPGVSSFEMIRGSHRSIDNVEIHHSSDSVSKGNIVHTSSYDEPVEYFSDLVELAQSRAQDIAVLRQELAFKNAQLLAQAKLLAAEMSSQPEVLTPESLDNAGLLTPESLDLPGHFGTTNRVTHRGVSPRGVFSQRESKDRAGRVFRDGQDCFIPFASSLATQGYYPQSLNIAEGQIAKGNDSNPFADFLSVSDGESTL